MTLLQRIALIIDATFTLVGALAVWIVLTPIALILKPFRSK